MEIDFVKVIDILRGDLTENYFLITVLASEYEIKNILNSGDTETIFKISLKRISTYSDNTITYITGIVDSEGSLWKIVSGNKLK